MPEAPPHKGEKTFRGIPVSGGVCRGKILVLGRSHTSIPRRDLAENEVNEEIGRLEKALVQTRQQILEVQRKVSAGMGAQVTSVDISQTQLDIAAGRARELGLAINFVRADVTDFDWIARVGGGGDGCFAFAGDR